MLAHVCLQWVSVCVCLCVFHAQLKKRTQLRVLGSDMYRIRQKSLPYHIYSCSIFLDTKHRKLFSCAQTKSFRTFAFISFHISLSVRQQANKKQKCLSNTVSKFNIKLNVLFFINFGFENIEQVLTIYLLEFLNILYY